jgi:hypothetical protein
MKHDEIARDCQDPTQEITIRIPCVLAERVSAYARDNANTFSSVIVEALDFFLRRRPQS